MLSAAPMGMTFFKLVILQADHNQKSPVLPTTPQLIRELILFSWLFNQIKMFCILANLLSLALSFFFFFFGHTFGLWKFPGPGIESELQLQPE